MEEIRARSLLKAISWRCVGTLDTFIISWIVTGTIVIASTIAFTEIITKIFIYTLHERLWNKITWGRYDTKV